MRPTSSVILLALTACVPEPPIADDPSAEPIATASDWFTTVQRRISDGEYQLRATTDGQYGFSNRAQALRVVVDGVGVEIRPRGDEGVPADWVLRVHTTAVDGRPVTMGVPRPGACVDSRVDERGECLRRAERSLGGDVTEWWANTPSGLEQGWTIESAPRGEAQSTIDVAFDGFDVSLDGPHSAVLTRNGTQIQYEGLSAWDATGRSLEAFMQTDGSGVRIVTHTQGATYPIHIDPLFASPSWRTNDAACGELGYSVAGVGDLDGDGYPDVAVGAPSFTRGQQFEGAVLVYRGGPAGLEDTIWWSTQSDKAWAQIGESVAGAGDVNGDGFDDLLVGAPNWVGPNGTGSVALYLGSSAGMASTPDWSRVAGPTEQGLGESVASAGDVNGDGFDDIVVGAPDATATMAYEGKVLVFEGGPGGLDSAPSLTLVSGQASTWFGRAVSTAGDVDGDGFDDILVGAAQYDGGQGPKGAAFLYRGSAAGTQSVAAWSVLGEMPNLRGPMQFVAGGGDLNGDGFDDVVVGFPDQGFGGEAHAFHGSALGLSPTADWVATSGAEAAILGTSVAIVGDVDNDGFDDVAVGAPWYDVPNLYKGMFALYHGSSAGLLSSPTTQNLGVSKTYLGWSLAGAGDVDGDGYGDVLVGAPGITLQCDAEAILYRGGPDGLEGVEFTLTSDLPVDSSFTRVAAAGDPNGDGFSDVLVGAPLYDNGFIEAGATFLYEGSSQGLVVAASWSAEGNQEDHHFGTSVTGAGDVDGDGYDDILVGANGAPDATAFLFAGAAGGPAQTPMWSTSFAGTVVLNVATVGDVNGDGYADLAFGDAYQDAAFNNAGFVVVYHGGPVGPGVMPNTSMYGSGANAYFGSSMAGAEDVDGDGFHDLVVGAPGAGRAELFLGSAAGLGASASWSLESSQTGSKLGHSVAMPGDIDGDGFADLAVGAPYFNKRKTDEGAVAVVPGSAAGPLTAQATKVYGGYRDVRLGVQVVAAGDVNGDGFADIVATAIGTTPRLYLGSAGGIGAAPAWEVPAVWGRGESAAGAGDLNGDGYDDLVFIGNNALWVFYGSTTGPVETP